MKNVFDAHKDVNEIYVVNGMPFLDKKAAESYARSNKDWKVKTVKRRGKPTSKKEESEG